MIIRQEQMLVLATASGGQPIVPCAKCAFEISIALVDHTDGKILTPLGIPYYYELPSGTSKTKDYAAFDITIATNNIEKLSVEIALDSGSTRRQVYTSELGPEYLQMGHHKWSWDGYGNDDVLDTRVLKSPDLFLELRAELCGVVKTAVIHFRNTAASEDYVDVRIDRGGKTINVEWRCNLVDGVEWGVGSSVPSELLTTWWHAHPLRRGPASLPSFLSKHAGPQGRTRTFQQLQQKALDGVAKYWSRDATNGSSVSTAVGVYTLSVHATVQTQPAMVAVALDYNTNGAWGRSSNPGKSRDFVSLFANFIPKRIIYNSGWIFDGAQGGWDYKDPAKEDRMFAYTAAHELGHEILSAYGGSGYSYTHRGTADIFQNQLSKLSTSGQQDLMTYPMVGVASESDALSLVWLARVRFSQ